MTLRDGILFTLFNTIACLVFPRILSVICATKKVKAVQEKPQISVTTPEPSPEIPSFSLR
ncbi:MAG TPA: hypothetical protein VK184_14680 [Nostocaceae cyanobacterium]|nr:hypothetical protein [Nostocaceae cyanobacterium]